MITSRKVYMETSCFVEIAKHALGTGSEQWKTDIWHLHELLKAGRDGKVKILTSTLTIAECQHAEEPGSDGIPSDIVKSVFKKFLTSGQYVELIQDTILVAESARNLRWVHGIAMKGADAIHAASAMELSCDEFLSFDQHFHRKKTQFDAIAVRVCMPRNTTCLPMEYRQEKLLLPSGE